MIDLKTLPQELQFLQLFVGDRHHEYKQSQWLVSNPEDDIWQFKFGTHQAFSINFMVKLDDQSLLTDYKNTELLDAFKRWICIQTHYDISGTVIYSAKTAYQAVRKVVALIDYFLINSAHFKLSKYGLLNISENDIKTLMAEVASSREIATGIYQWPTKLAHFLRSGIKNYDLNLLQRVIKENPFLSTDIPESEDHMMDFSKQEIIFARAFLWDSGLYKSYYRPTECAETYRYCPNTTRITQILYANTLSGVNQRPHPIELLLQPVHVYKREFAKAPVRDSTEDVMGEKDWLQYRKVIRSLGQLNEIGVSVPSEALKITNTITTSDYALKLAGRFRTLPPKLVLDSLKSAFEFALTFGPEILDSVIRVITVANKKNISCVTLSSTDEFEKLISPKLQNLGVKVWSLKSHKRNFELQMPYKQINVNSAQDYFSRMRNHEGLLELYRVLMGAIQFAIGTLMARRQGELMDLEPGKSLDKKHSYLIFDNRKSGIAGMRSTEAKPIPSIAVKLILMLDRFHMQLEDLGLSSKHTKLFSHPELHKGAPITLLPVIYNNNLDYFCDYIQTPLNEKGERYYFRQHQLRRFFAMMFFWGGAFGGMDALRWFLGHTDIEHLYHYITETTPGYVLRASKGYFACELLKSKPNDAPELAELVRAHFGTHNFRILDSTELEEFIEELQLENRLTIEPIFLKGPMGKEYQIAVKVLAKGA